MVQLTKTITQLKEHSDEIQSEMLITVEYNPEDKVVRQVICIHVKEPHNPNPIDVTAIIAEHFDDSLEKMLEGNDWWEVYRETQEASKAA